jgi:dolichol-phosphate mannosyltransferase
LENPLYDFAVKTLFLLSVCLQDKIYQLTEPLQMKSDSLVIIPTYNECENIEAIINAVFNLNKAYHILVVEDNSPDGTAAIVKRLMDAYPNQLFIEERKGKLGLGTAYIHGFRWALRRGYEYIFEMDADFSHNPNDLTRLYDACAKEGADVAIGSRYINGVNVVNWPMGRVLMSYYASAYVRFITRLKVRDTTAGFICWKRKVLETINLDKVKFVGYAFQIEMKYSAWKLGFEVKEVPIIFTDRTDGVSKMTNRIFKEAVLGVITLRLRGLFGRIKPAG